MFRVRNKINTLKIHPLIWSSVHRLSHYVAHMLFLLFSLNLCRTPLGLIDKGLWSFSLPILPRFLNFSIIYLKNKEMQQTLRFIVRKHYAASFSANDINSWKQYVCVK